MQVQHEIGHFFGKNTNGKIKVKVIHDHRRSQDFLLGGALTTNHMHDVIRSFQKRNFFVGQRYRRMEDLKP